MPSLSSLCVLSSASVFSTPLLHPKIADSLSRPAKGPWCWPNCRGVAAASPDSVLLDRFEAFLNETILKRLDFLLPPDQGWNPGPLQ